jgi:cell division protein FtsQ
MSNKKAKSVVSRLRRAPADPASAFPAAETSPVRGVLGWLALGSKVVLGTALVLSVSGALAFGLHRYARTTPRFAIVEISVEGTRRLFREDILAAAGILPGQNIFVLDVQQAERRLLKSPWIKHARVTRHLPNRVSVEVREQDPVALTVLAGRTLLVSGDGEPFKALDAGDPHDLPLVTGLSMDELTRDRRAELGRLREALALLRDFEELPLARAEPAEEVHLTDDGMAVLTIGGGAMELHLGAAPWKPRLLEAMQVIRSAGAQGGRPAAVFVDNQAHPERAVVRLR